MTAYRMLVPDRMLELRAEGGWLPVEGFRLVSVDGEWFPDAPMKVCTFEDDGAPPELEGQLVTISTERTGGVTRITDRRLVRQ